MIDSKNYVENVPPTITINDEAFNNNVQLLTLYQDEQNNNFPLEEDSRTIEYCSQNDQINGNFLCLSNDSERDFEEIPLSALRTKSRDLLSKRLNSIKVILSEDGIPRDWRGVLNSIGLSDVVNTVQQKPDEMKEVLELWINTRKDTAKIGTLQKILEKIDRWDVLDDTREYFVEDAKIYLKALSKPGESEGFANQSSEYKERTLFDESELLTHDDIARAKMGLPPQRYDAYLLFDSDHDIDFATQIIDRMETEYKLKLCLKERDLIGGTFENDAIMKMISERCDRLIVIFSNAFFHSLANTFFVKFAQALGIEQRKRKIIPCMNEKCDLPASLAMYFTLRYRDETPYFNFWNKLYESIHVPFNRMSSPMPRITITEIDSPSVPSIQSQPQSQQATFQSYNNSDTKKIKSKSSSPNTPTSLKKLWNNLPKKIGSQSSISSSMWTLRVGDNIFDKENERCHSSLSLNNSMSSPTPTKHKKTKAKWFKKLLSPSSTYKLSAAESDSSAGVENASKKKKWYRKRFRSRSRSKNRERELEAAVNEI
ncbi:myeloid differentiation primary response protein MyD88 [Contarinia nasturtii]|uniref:myeloid differentiation primary response protein MyD88 n=1 Tax=Contarinia nasturtii TaxID=265458 RepID=UPI0012D44918|nr:myeloid differentiation primary response protein MyD88 [Contarinia nasturtii]